MAPRARHLTALAALVVGLGTLTAALAAFTLSSADHASRPHAASRTVVDAATASTAPRSDTTTSTTTPPRVFTATGNRAGFAHGYELVHVDGPDDVNADLDAMAATGARWLRAGIDWSFVEGRARGAYDWTRTDLIVRGARARGLSVVAVATGAPDWALAGRSCPANSCPPTALEDYAAFVQVAVTRYMPIGVHAWELWNEPNNAPFWGPRANVAAYTRLLQLTYPAIKAVDPTATVITGGLAQAGDTGRDLAPLTFLRGIYEHGGKASFDAVGYHPYAFPFPPMAALPYNAFLQTRALHDLMASEGDGAKHIWGTEAGAPTRGTDSVTEAQQAEWVTQYYDTWNSWSFTGPLLWYTLRDRGTSGDVEDHFGLYRHDRTSKPALTAFDSMIARSAPVPADANP